MQTTHHNGKLYEVASFLPPAISKIGNKTFIVAGGMFECLAGTTRYDLVWQPTKKRQAKTQIVTLLTTTKASSNGKEQYNIVVTNQVATCSCIGFKYHRKCKHLRQALDENQLWDKTAYQE